MADMCKCCNCGAIFPVEDVARIEECVGEFWGAPAFEHWDACPVCKDTDIEDYEPMEYWVSYYLQDGTQTGGTLTVTNKENAYDQLEEQLKKIHGDNYGGIADYGEN